MTFLQNLIEVLDIWTNSVSSNESVTVDQTKVHENP